MGTYIIWGVASMKNVTSKTANVVLTSSHSGLGRPPPGIWHLVANGSGNPVYGVWQFSVAKKDCFAIRLQKGNWILKKCLF